MRRNKARFVTACQQSLALGAVLAVLAPAANVISLDVVGTRPGTPVEAAPAAPRDGRQLSAPGTSVPSDHEESRVETAPVEPTVEDVPMQPGRGPARRPRDAPRS